MSGPTRRIQAQTLTDGKVRYEPLFLLNWRLDRAYLPKPCADGDATSNSGRLPKAAWALRRHLTMQAKRFKSGGA